MSKPGFHGDFCVAAINQTHLVENPADCFLFSHVRRVGEYHNLAPADRKSCQRLQFLFKVGEAVLYVMKGNCYEQARFRGSRQMLGVYQRIGHNYQVQRINEPAREVNARKLARKLAGILLLIFARKTALFSLLARFERCPGKTLWRNMTSKMCRVHLDFCNELI